MRPALCDPHISIVRGNQVRVLGEPWASPETAERNLKNVRVRIHSVDVQGVEKLTAALHEVGVRLTKRSADLTVTLVNDYLEEGLAELNRQHLSDRTSWLLVQPSGVFPLVGPVFRPGKSACWSCLAERMRRNREVKAFLDRKKSIPIVTSTLARNLFGESGIQLAAVEIAKAIATDFRTQLGDHIISLDLLGSTIMKHYVATRPQCPACGKKALRDPGPYAEADRARHWGQADYDERRIPICFTVGDRCTFPKACEPPYRRRFSVRTHPSRPPFEHQLLCHPQLCSTP
jgi:bacteriocin biosynthesis cyclodehydratase domain-containing protein